MKLSALLSSLHISSKENPEILGVTEDSRTVQKGFLFFARKGYKVSGLDYVKDAVSKGAAAVITDQELPDVGVPVIRISDMSLAQSKIADAFYGHPSKSLTVVGVTGTNGKTTFTYLMESIAQVMGWRTGVIGTINYRLPSESGKQEILSAPNTTPNALELHRILALMRDRKVDLAVMEVSSHALALGRADDVAFDGAVFTNLTQDHLDFHKTMEDYFEAKSKLFKMTQGAPKSGTKVRCDKFCIINADDDYGRRLMGLSPAKTLAYGVKGECAVKAENIALSAVHTEFRLTIEGQSARVRMNLLGLHNVYNALSAAGAAYGLNIPFTSIVEGLEQIESIPGRLESVKCGQDFAVLVDYAHTEDALKNVLHALKSFAKKRVLTLFGCGGDRDRSKRPLMGAAAAALSDWVVVTSDNPRSESPEKIALDIEAGIRRTGKTNYEVILDRETAIGKILKSAKKDDIILIAGKGHETYQIFADKTIHFDDREMVQKFLCSH